MKNVKLTKKAKNLLLAGLIGVTLSSPVEGLAVSNYSEIYDVNYDWNQDDFYYENNYGFSFESGYIIPEIETSISETFNVNINGTTYTYQDVYIEGQLNNQFGEGEYNLNYCEEKVFYTVYFIDQADNYMEYDFQDLEEAMVFASINNAYRIVLNSKSYYYADYVLKTKEYVYPEFDIRMEYHGTVIIDDYETTYSKSSFEELERQIQEDYPNTERYYDDNNYYNETTFYNVYGIEDRYQVTYDEMLDYAKNLDAYKIEEVTIYSDTYLLKHVKTYVLPDINNILITEVEMYIDDSYNTSYRDNLEDAIIKIKSDYPNLEFKDTEELGIIDSHYSIYYNSNGEIYTIQEDSYQDMLDIAEEYEAYQIDCEEVLGYRFNTYTKQYVMPQIQEREMYLIKLSNNGNLIDARRGQNYEVLVNELQESYPDIKVISSAYTSQSEVEYRVYYFNQDNFEDYEIVYDENELENVASFYNSNKIEKIIYSIYQLEGISTIEEEYILPTIEINNIYQLSILIDNTFVESIEKSSREELESYIREYYSDYTIPTFDELGLTYEGYSIYFKDSNNEPREMYNLSYDDMIQYAKESKAYRIIKSSVYGYEGKLKTNTQDTVLAPIIDINSYYINLIVDGKLVDQIETLDTEEFKQMISTKYSNYELVSSIPVGVKEVFYEVYYNNNSVTTIDESLLKEFQKDTTVKEIRKITVNEYEYSIQKKVEEYTLPNIENSEVYTVKLYINGRLKDTIEKNTLEDAENYFISNYQDYSISNTALLNDTSNYTIYYKDNSLEKQKSYTDYNKMIKEAKKYKAYRIVEVSNISYRLDMKKNTVEYQMPLEELKTSHTLILYIDGNYVNGYEFDTVETGIRKIQDKYVNYTNITLSEARVRSDYYKIYYYDSNNKSRYINNIDPSEINNYAKKYKAYRIVHVLKYEYDYTMDSVSEYQMPNIEEEYSNVKALIYLNGEGILQAEGPTIEGLMQTFDSQYEGIYTSPELFSMEKQCNGWILYVDNNTYAYSKDTSLQEIQKIAKEINATRIVQNIKPIYKYNVTELLVSDDYKPEIVSNNTYRLVVKKGKNGKEIANLEGSVDELNATLTKLSKKYNLEQGNKYASAGYWRLYYNDNGVTKTIDINSTYGHREMLKYAESINAYKIEEFIEYTYNYSAERSTLFKAVVLISGSLVLVSLTSLGVYIYKKSK